MKTTHTIETYSNPQDSGLTIQGKKGNCVKTVVSHPNRSGIFMLGNEHKRTGVFITTLVFDNFKTEDECLLDFEVINEEDGWTKYNGMLYFVTTRGFVTDAESLDYTKLRGIDKRVLTSNTINKYSLL